jgi:hypothetical protein
VRLEVEVIAGDSRLLVARTRDVSMKGIFLVTSHRLPAGTSCRIRIRIGDPAEPLWVEADGRVVRSDAEGVAVEFAEMGVSSFHHLKNLVMYNAADPARVEGELGDHVGLKRP